jgi:hypothetical protein
MEVGMEEGKQTKQKNEALRMQHGSKHGAKRINKAEK